MNARTIIAEAGKIRAVSQAAIKLLDLLHLPDVNNDDIVQTLRLDPVITAHVLRICNSVYCGAQNRIDSIEEAILRVGQQELLRLVMALSFGGILSKPVAGYAIQGQELWHHSLVTALAAQEVAKECTALDVQVAVAYTAGLLHDFGKQLMDYALTPEIQTQLRNLIQEKNCSRIEAERMVLQTDHAEVGAQLLESWKLPETIAEAVAHHHDPVTTPQPKLSAVVHLANCIAHFIGSAPGWEAYAMRVQEDVPQVLGMKPEKLEQFLITTHEGLGQVEQFLAVI
jgi:putative nucleotidyltransferase with HDIG domain